MSNNETTAASNAESAESPITRPHHVGDTGPISANDAIGMVLRFCHSHFDKGRHDPGREHARISIPTDPRRDDDIRLIAFIKQSASRIADLEREKKELGEKLELMTSERDEYLDRMNDAKKERDELRTKCEGYVEALGWIAHFSPDELDSAETLHYDMQGVAAKALATISETSPERTDPLKITKEAFNDAQIIATEALAKLGFQGYIERIDGRLNRAQSRLDEIESRIKYPVEQRPGIADELTYEQIEAFAENLSPEDKSKLDKWVMYFDSGGPKFRRKGTVDGDNGGNVAEEREKPATPLPWSVAALSDRVELSGETGIVFSKDLPASPEAYRIIKDFVFIAASANAYGSQSSKEKRSTNPRAMVACLNQHPDFEATFCQLPNGHSGSHLYEESHGGRTWLNHAHPPASPSPAESPREGEPGGGK